MKYLDVYKSILKRKIKTNPLSDIKAKKASTCLLSLNKLESRHGHVYIPIVSLRSLFSELSSSFKQIKWTCSGRGRGGKP